jgi:hypothetical protein
MRDVENFVAEVARDLRILVAVQRALTAMELVQDLKIEVEGIRGRLNFSNEIGCLKEVVHLMGSERAGPPVRSTRE